MKLVKLVGVVALLGVISASQVKASVFLPSEHSLKAPNVTPAQVFQKVSKGKVTAVVPEPSDWAWLPVLSTVGFIAWRRLRRQAVA